MNKKNGEISSVYKTLAILNKTDKTGKAKVTVPPLSSAKEAKDWVDHNEK